MIDWFSLFANALWIVGLAVLLAATSWNFYVASLNRTGLRAQFSSPAFALTASIGMVLVLLGLALNKNGSLWQTIIWGLLALGFLYVAWLSFKTWRNQPADA